MDIGISINYLALLGAAVAAMAVGFVWYSPAVFGKKWAAASGMSPEKIEAGKKGMSIGIIGGFVCQLVTGYVLINFIETLGLLRPSEGLELAFWAWFGFMAVPSLHAVFWERKPLAYWAINAGYQLAAFGVMSVILVMWQ